MKKVVSVLMLITLFAVFSSSLYAKDFKAIDKAKAALNFFKLADEIELTDEQLIQLRSFYKKHYSEPAKKFEKPDMPSSETLFYMNEEQLRKIADDESKKVHEKMMGTFQKIIDIKKILTYEQLKKIKSLCEEEAKKSAERKAIFDKLRNSPNKVKFNRPGYFKSTGQKLNPTTFNVPQKPCDICPMHRSKMNQGHCPKFKFYNQVHCPKFKDSHEKIFHRPPMDKGRCYNNCYKPNFDCKQGFKPMPNQGFGSGKAQHSIHHFLMKLLSCQKNKKDDKLIRERRAPKGFESEKCFGSLKDKGTDLPSAPPKMKPEEVKATK